MPRKADDPPRCLIVGEGRAGRSFALALRQAAWSIDLVSSRRLDALPPRLVEQADVILLAVADGAIPEVAARLAELDGPVEGVVAHVSGACTLDVLTPHRRVASIHPLMSLPDAEIGSARLSNACTFAVDGDREVVAIVDALGGRAIEVAAENRAVYHAAASVAANHLTALCAQVERLASDAGVPADAYWPLMSTTLANVAEVGSTAALTGPAARGDWSTVRAHLDAIGNDERPLYLALCRRAAAIAGHTLPDDLDLTT